MKTIAKLLIMAEMKVSAMEDAKDEIADAIANTLVLEKTSLRLRLATRKDLEEMAEAGVLLPNPGVIEGRKEKK